MPEVEHFVNNMKLHMGTDVVFVTAHKTNLIIHRHANVINRIGENINLTIVDQAWQGLKECYRGLKKKMNGNLGFAELFRLMIVMMLLKSKERITLALANSTVWKQYVHPVV
jgi:hypothetical protein